MANTTLDFFIVPDYICSGVTEHYVKVSGVVSFPGTAGKNIFSAIVNKKTGNIQKQSRVRENGTIRQMSTIVFGQGYRKALFSRGIKEYAELVYNRLDDETRRLVDKAMVAVQGAMIRNIATDMALRYKEVSGVRDAMEKIVNAYNELRRSGTIPQDEVGKNTPVYELVEEKPEDNAIVFNENWTPVPDDILDSMDTEEVQTILKLINSNDDGIAVVNENEYRLDKQTRSLQTRPHKAITSDYPISAPSTPEAVAEIARKSVMMARMANAGAMTEFVDGNLYRFKENSETDMSGMKYILLYNEAGEERWVNRSKVVITKVFTEPPELERKDD